MAILKIRDKAGNVIPVPAIVGPPGKDGKTAYEYAKDGGFTGSEEEFAMNMAEGKSFEVDKETLTLENGVLKVNTATVVEADNTRPVSSAAVHTQIGNIEALLNTI